MRKNSLFGRISFAETRCILSGAAIISISAIISIFIITLREIKTTNLLADVNTVTNTANSTTVVTIDHPVAGEDEPAKAKPYEDDSIYEEISISEIPLRIKDTKKIRRTKYFVPAEQVFSYGRNFGKKYAFLTFDDGPSKNVTPQVLEILRKYNVSATFFVLGSAVENNPELVKQIYEYGHAIANHTYSHDYEILYPNKTVNVQAFKTEVNKTIAAIVAAIGTTSASRVVRFPSGSFESWKKPMKEELINSGMYYVDWNAENRDGIKNDVSLDEQLEAITNNIGNAEGTDVNLIVLMHDSSTKQSTVDALPAIIELIKSKGYEFAIIK
ncbi:polysaccharide deacetylase family protein [Clostridium thermarum]|uniref:polysaccharide deacetylase family protein n=1 Tax=Clostridium thermarum TaxID=1716543 RepID=UPI0013D426A2|nr:polysaccharide deacetylase family protein [Clostridium thermarum]